MGSHSRQRALVLAALFLSGVAGLMHEVVWAKLLANLTGSTAKSHAVVLSVFMGGLAIGAVVFGRRSDKRERPLLVYVALELLIGAYCLVLPWITEGAGFVYEQVAGAVFEQQGLKVPLRLLLSLFVVSVPAILMGGTLPVLARYLIEEVAQTRKQVASLYALNNIGAVLGSGAAGFYLLPEFGIYGSLISASTLNFVAAGLVWWANSRTQYVAGGASAAEASAHASLPSYSAGQFRTTLWALALSGFAAMGYEVVFLRIIALGFGSSTYSFTVMLMCFITGIGVGSAIISLIDVRRPMWWLAVSQLGVVVSILSVTPIIERLPYLVSSWRTLTLEFSPDLSISEPVRSSFELFVLGQAGLCFAILILPTLLIGMGFPLVSQIQARSMSNLGGTIGSTYAWNTIGNVLGVVVTSLGFMPWLGMEHSLHVNVALNVLAALLLIAAASETAFVPRAAALAAGLAALVIYADTWTQDLWKSSRHWIGWATTINHSEGHLRLREGPFDGTVRSAVAGRVQKVAVRAGNRVDRSAPLVSLETALGTTEITAPTPGIVLDVHVNELEKVDSGAKLVTMQSDDESIERQYHPAKSFAAWKRKYVRDQAREGWEEMYLDEDPDTTVMALKRGRSTALYVNSKGDASTGPLDMITFLLTGHIPMFLLPDAKDVMVIGHGSGVTTGGMLQHPIERLDMVEISKGVLGADELFAWANHDCLKDPRTHIYIDDARTFLRTVPRKYDLIVSQPSNPWIAGIGSLFTVDFFQDCKNRLKPGGAMVVWFHHYEQSDETIQLIVRTVAEVFPQVQSFLTYNSDVITLASPEPLGIDFARMEERFDQPAIRSDLGRVGVFNLATVLAYHAVDPARFRDFLGRGPLNTDDHQLLEYKGARNMYAGRDAYLLADPRPREQREADKDHAAPAELLNAPYFDPLPDGGTSWLLDRYVAWRAAQGAPVTRAELEVAKNTTNNILTGRHRLAKLVARRAEATPEGGASSSQPSRGGQVPVGELEYSESFNRAVYLAFVGRSDEARMLFQRAVELEPTSADAVTRLAQMEFDRPNPKAAELQPKVLEIQAKLQEGKNDEAQALQLAAKPLWEEWNALERAKFEAAEKILLDAMARESEHARVDNNVDLVLAGLYLRFEKTDKAVEIYQRLIDEEENPVALTRMGELVTAYGENFKQAQDYWRRAIAREPKEWQAAANLARTYINDAMAATDSAESRDELFQRALSVVKCGLYYNPSNNDLLALRDQLQPPQRAPDSAQPAPATGG